MLSSPNRIFPPTFVPTSAAFAASARLVRGSNATAPAVAKAVCKKFFRETILADDFSLASLLALALGDRPRLKAVATSDVQPVMAMEASNRTVTALDVVMMMFSLVKENEELGGSTVNRLLRQLTQK